MAKPAARHTPLKKNGGQDQSNFPAQMQTLLDKMPVVKSALIFVLIAALLVVSVVVADEAWNGLVKTDMGSIGATRDVSQSKVIPAPAVPFGGAL